MALDSKTFVVRFVEEARDHLRRIEDGLVQLNANPDDKELINAIFRSAHTIKGSSRMVKILPVSETAHKLEDVLGAVREGSLAWTGEIGRLIQQGVDVIASQVDAVAGEQPPLPLDESLATQLVALLAPSGTVVETQQASPSPSPSPPSPPSPSLSLSLNPPPFLGWPRSLLGPVRGGYSEIHT